MELGLLLVRFEVDRAVDHVLHRLEGLVVVHAPLERDRGHGFRLPQPVHEPLEEVHRVPLVRLGDRGAEGEIREPEVGIFLLERWATTRALIFAARHGWSLELLESLRVAATLLIMATITVIGTWAASRVEKSLGRKDPSIVVVDEVAGQLVALLFLPFNASIWLVITGFLFFRLFDIWKPYPIRKLESLESGLGIMADDILAGVYAAILLSIVTTIYLSF